MIASREAGGGSKARQHPKTIEQAQADSLLPHALLLTTHRILQNGAVLELWRPTFPISQSTGVFSSSSPDMSTRLANALQTRDSTEHTRTS